MEEFSIDKLKAVLFDFDGVLGKTMEDNYKAWKKVFLDHGVELSEEEYFPFEGIQLKEYAKKIIEKYNLEDVNPEDLVKKKDENYMQSNSFSLYPKVEETIDLLKNRGILIAIVSAGYRPRLSKCAPEEFLSKFGAIITGDKIERGKPHPDPYLKAMEELNVKPNECIVVENAPLGVKAGKSSGAYCIAIASTMDPKYLDEADKVINKFEDLEF